MTAIRHPKMIYREVRSLLSFIEKHESSGGCSSDRGCAGNLPMKNNASLLCGFALMDGSNWQSILIHGSHDTR
jgi:hypothetical protein